MRKRLDGKVAVVTGAGRGIGRAIARRLAQDGALVAVNYAHSAQAAHALVEEIQRGGGDAFAVAADIADLKQIEAMFAQIGRRAGQIDILINNAGRGSAGMPSLDAVTPESYDFQFALNTRGLFFTTQHALRLMRDGGRIVNLSSTSTLARVAGISVYAGTKAAVEAFTRIWAVELAPRRITVNAILPGMVDTDLITDNMPAGVKEMAAKQHPANRIGQPEDIAGMVGLLCADEAQWVSGDSILVSGGS